VRGPHVLRPWPSSLAVVPQAWCLPQSPEKPVRSRIVSPVECFGRRIVHMLVAVAGPLAVASCGSAVETVTAPVQVRCGIDVNAQDVSFSAAGGTGTIRISTNRECAWSVRSDAAWLTVSSPASGQGAASVQYSVAANPDPPTRNARIYVEDQQLQISQEGTPCEFRLSSRAESVDQSGGQRTIEVSTKSAQCRWTAVADSAWIAVTAGHSASGNGAVSFTVEATTGPERTGTITVAGLVVTVTQSRGCRYLVDPSTTTVASSGGTGGISIRTGAGCGWTATSTADWLTLSSASGSGPGEVRFAVGPWNGPMRAATLRIADQTATVSQASGCTVSFSPATLSADASGLQSAVQVNTMPGCAWSAASGATWITVASGATGSGDGQVQLIVASNSGPARDGSVTIAGRSLAVAQASGCTYAVTPTLHAVGGAGGTRSILVTTAGACRWTISSHVDWITIDATSIMGSGAPMFTVAPNPGAPRTGTFSAAGQTVTVNQASR
jgi:hypothetical protein